MYELALLLHYGSISIVVALATLGAGIGGGLAGLAAMDAINIQPSAEAEITKTSIIGLALIETAAILSFILIILLLKSPIDPLNETAFYQSIAETGIACAVGIAGFIIGIVSALPIQQACYSIARQPFFGQNITNIMLITQTLIQSPIIFGFLISLLIKWQIPSITNLTQSITLLASGLCIGIGSIGPAIGLAKFAQTACQSVSINRQAYGQLLSFSFMSQGVIETPIIFAFIISILLLRNSSSITPDSFLSCIKILAAAFCTAIGTFGPGLNSSKTAAAACKRIAFDQQQYGTLSQVSLFSQGLIDAAAIYALLISLWMLFF